MSKSLNSAGCLCLCLVNIVCVLTVLVVLLTVSSKAMFSIAAVTAAVSILMSVGATSGICAPIRSNWLLSPGIETDYHPSKLKVL